MSIQHTSHEPLISEHKALNLNHLFIFLSYEFHFIVQCKALCNLQSQ